MFNASYAGWAAGTLTGYAYLLDFDNAAGRKLTGVLETGDGAVRAWAVFAHCFTCSKDLAAARRIAIFVDEAQVGEHSRAPLVAALRKRCARIGIHRWRRR